jgi:hypothetical protein
MMQDLSLHFLDIAENSIEAKARRVAIKVEERASKDRLVLEISDDGRGMGPALLARAADPFVTTKTTRRIGLVLSFLSQAAKASGGRLQIRSAPGRGTKVRATFRLSHMDRPPLGDAAESLVVLIAGHPETEFSYTHVSDSGRYVFRTRDLHPRPGGISPYGPGALAEIKKDIRSGVARLRRRRP